MLDHPASHLPFAGVVGAAFLGVVLAGAEALFQGEMRAHADEGEGEVGEEEVEKEEKGEPEEGEEGIVIGAGEDNESLNTHLRKNSILKTKLSRIRL